jgi:hypothetical protein
MEINGMMAIYSIQSSKISWKLSHQPLQKKCFGAGKTAFISNLNKTVIGITQLGCPELEVLAHPTLGCTFICRHKRHYYCARSTAYIVAKWRNYNIRIQSTEIPPKPGSHQYFQKLLENVFFLNTKQSASIAISLDAELTPQVKTASSSRRKVMMSGVHELDDFPLDVCRGR